LETRTGHFLGRAVRKGRRELGPALEGIGPFARLGLNVFGNNGENGEPLGFRKSRHGCALGIIQAALRILTERGFSLAPSERALNTL
jgi:hypothetical protein